MNKTLVVTPDAVEVYNLDGRKINTFPRHAPAWHLVSYLKKKGLVPTCASPLNLTKLALVEDVVESDRRLMERIAKAYPF